MLQYLLDTNVVSAPLSAGADSKVVRRMSDESEQCAIAAPVWHELVYGTMRIPRGKRRAAMESYLHDVIRASFPILAYDEIAAAWHGRERARLEAAGKTPPFVDGQIAAIAHTNNLILVTRNARDFSSFRDLQIESWS